MSGGGIGGGGIFSPRSSGEKKKSKVKKGEAKCLEG